MRYAAVLVVALLATAGSFARVTRDGWPWWVVAVTAAAGVGLGLLVNAALARKAR